MILNQSFTIRNRKQAALMLAERLMHLENSRAIIVGVPYGGAVIGYHLAEKLNLTFDIVVCKTIFHPDHRKTIGSVSIDQVVIHNDDYDIPRDYIYHQIVRNQNVLKAQDYFYRSGKQREINIRNAEVVLVGDVVKSADALIASIRTLRNQNPKRIIVAAPVFTSEAARQLTTEVDEIVSLTTEYEIPSGGFYEERTIVRDEDIRDLIVRSDAN
jgi:putative phosphoribosyl transferase